MEDIPEFLRIPQEERRACWRGRKMTKMNRNPTKVTRNEDASTRAFRKVVEKQEAEKKAMKFKLLRERHGKK